MLINKRFRLMDEFIRSMRIRLSCTPSFIFYWISKLFIFKYYLFIWISGFGLAWICSFKRTNRNAMTIKIIFEIINNKRLLTFRCNIVHKKY